MKKRKRKNQLRLNMSELAKETQYYPVFSSDNRIVSVRSIDGKYYAIDQRGFDSLTSESFLILTEQ